MSNAFFSGSATFLTFVRCLPLPLPVTGEELNVCIHSPFTRLMSWSRVGRLDKAFENWVAMSWKSAELKQCTILLTEPTITWCLD